MSSPRQNPNRPPSRLTIDGEVRKLQANFVPGAPSPQEFFIGGRPGAMGSAPPPIKGEVSDTWEDVMDGTPPSNPNPPAPVGMETGAAQGKAGNIHLVGDKQFATVAKTMTQQDKIIAVLAAGIAGYYVYQWKGPALAVVAAGAGYFGASKILSK